MPNKTRCYIFMYVKVQDKLNVFIRQFCNSIMFLLIPDSSQRCNKITKLMLVVSISFCSRIFCDKAAEIATSLSSVSIKRVSFLACTTSLQSSYKFSRILLESIIMNVIPSSRMQYLELELNCHFMRIIS